MMTKPIIQSFQTKSKSISHYYLCYLLIISTTIDYIRCVAVSLDGKWVVIASHIDWSIEIWDLQAKSFYHFFENAHTRIFS